jgi:hypothetical protein
MIGTVANRLPSTLITIGCVATLSVFGIMETVSAQIPSNVLLRVKKIEVGPSSGTAFTIEVDRRQYIVTAKHVVATLKGTDETVTLPSLPI